MTMINKSNTEKHFSADYQRLRREMSLTIYRAMPRGKEILCNGPTERGVYYNLSYQIQEATNKIASDVLIKGKASWCLNINPDKNSEIPFAFRPKSHPIRGHKTVRMVINSRDIGIPRKNVRRLAKRLKRSELPLSDLSLIRFNEVREQIADYWGHALSWHMSDPAIFTDPCILLNQCDSKILAIKLCEAIIDAMNETLAKSGLSCYRIEIPTFSKKELETSRRLFVEGKIEQKVFSDLVFSEV